MGNVAVVITCPHCGRDQSVEICGIPSPEEMPPLPHTVDATTVCDHCERDITLHMTLHQRTMLDGLFFGQVPGGPEFPGSWFGLS